jgi:hypothetical protein
METTILSQTANNFETKVFNHFSNGWTGETFTGESGSVWQITTVKRASGFISSTATKVDISDGLISWSFGAKQIFLIKEKARATENTIKDIHSRALEIFLAHPDYTEEAQKPVYKIEIGQRVFLDGYGKGQTDGNAIIYQINGDRNFLTVDTDTLELSHVSWLRPYSDKFGIGTYYVENDKFNGSIDELNNIVIDAKAKQQRDQEALQIANEKEEEERRQKIEEGKKLVSIPSGAVAVVVADLYAFNGDSMTDYFSTTILKTVVLGFSSSKNNNMNELKKYALNFEETATHPEEGEKFENKNESGSYGPSYYLGPNGWNGWKVNKRGKYDGLNIENEHGKEEIYLAAAEGRYFVNEAEEPTTEKAPNFEAVQVPEGEIQIIDYSEKAFAVIGETKPIKDKLKDLGGKFNFRLSCGAGWIFSKTKLEEVTNFLSGAI